MIASSEAKLCIGGTELLSRTFVFGDNQQTCVTLYSPSLAHRKFLRVQYGCLFGAVFGSQDCDCSQQIQNSISIIKERGGVLVYFRDHEAFGLGLFEKTQILHEEKIDAAKQSSALEYMHSHHNRHSVLYFLPEILAKVGVPNKLVLLGENTEKNKIISEIIAGIDTELPLKIDGQSISAFGKREIEWKSERYQVETVDSENN